MKILYNGAKRNFDNTRKNFTKSKTYDVLADYRKRKSGFITRDDGFVVVDDLNQHNMIFADECIIIDSDIRGVYIFDYKKDK